ncbi:uncharacterized protein [Littorina saxatilis]|uniref:uncharacterized protein n=1 Tax=Littorina saxatilis TaxID=31220 RepID=UPI0038B4944F
MRTEYTAVQKISMAAMVLGAGMCVVGGLAPYWIVSDPQGFDDVVSLVSQVVKGRLGLLMYCLEVLGVSGCEVYGAGTASANGDSWISKELLLGVLCMLLGVVAAFLVLCLACCTCCRRLICLGIISFLSAVAGAACAALFSQDAEIFTARVAGFQLASYGWAIYVFCIGVALLGLASFAACFATPPMSSQGAGTVISQPPTTVMVNTDNATSGYYGQPQWQGQGQSMGEGRPWQGQGQVGSPWQGQGQVTPSQFHDLEMIQTPDEPGVSTATTKQ